MRVCIIGFANLKFMPYLYQYTNILDLEEIEYDIVYWNRDGDFEKFYGQGKVIEFKDQMNTTISRLRKIKYLIKYKKFVYSNIEKNNYDKIIVLTTLPAMLLKKKLIKKYKNRYIFDYRDYTYEKSKIYQKMLTGIIKNSKMTVISSEGFKNFLPKYPYVLCNNINIINTNNYFMKNVNKKSCIVIGYIGLIRQDKFNIRFIERFRNNKNIKLLYKGSGSAENIIRSFVIKEGIMNAVVEGKFNQEEKGDIISKVDIINNVFDNDLTMKYAISNRMYDAILYRKPQIVNKDTYMAKIVMENGLGLAIDVNSKEVANLILEWYSNLDWNKFYKNCDEFLEKIKKENDYFKKEVKVFIK